MAVGVAAEVKSKLSVVDVVGESVALRKAGTTLKGLCPFHAEKTPSFVVTPGRESWHCFGCGEGGDIFSFVMKRDGLSFPEALKRLAARAGVELDERTSREDAHRARLRDVLETAIAFYHTVLTGHRSGQAALDYLRGRGFTDETIERYQLGWAPAGWDDMSRLLQARRGIEPRELAEVGLTTARASGRGAYDKFRRRVIFPIRDANGGPVGLGGRLLPAADGEADGDRGPKYLNSPATPLFDKSRTLYLIDRAKSAIRKGGEAVIVEGYTDALMAHQAGFDNVVAALGTALTPDQVATLGRYATRIALAYDVDPAGEHAGSVGVAALEAIIPQLAAANVGVELGDVQVVRLPDGKDPDEVIRDTPDLWRESVRTALPIVEYLIAYHAERHDLRSTEGRARFVEALLPTLRNVADPVRRDGYLGRLRQVSGVEERVLLEALHRRPAASDGGRGTPVRGRITADAVLAAPDALPVTEILRALSPTEQELLRLVLLVPEHQERVAEHLRQAELRLPSTPGRELLAAMLADRERDREAGGPGRFERGRFLESLDAETKGLALALYAWRGPDPADLDPDRVAYGLGQCLWQLEHDANVEAMDYTRAEIEEAERLRDAARLDQLLDEQRRLHEARRSLDRRRDDASLLARPMGGTR
ncbi:MAG TPA: DNA primase [Candidatus Limnocylindrales bacterium]